MLEICFFLFCWSASFWFKILVRVRSCLVTRHSGYWNVFLINLRLEILVFGMVFELVCSSKFCFLKWFFCWSKRNSDCWYQVWCLSSFVSSKLWVVIEVCVFFIDLSKVWSLTCFLSWCYSSKFWFLCTYMYLMKHFVFLCEYMRFWSYSHSFRPYFAQLMTVGPGRLGANCWGDVGVDPNLIFEFEICKWSYFFRNWELIFDFWMECEILSFVLGLWVWYHGYKS